MMSERAVIRTSKLTKSFGDLVAVNQLDLEIFSGEVFGFLGPNGAGKTTTLRMLTALLSPTSGTAEVLGLRVGENDQLLRSKIGLLPEAPGLYAALNAEENLSFYGAMYGLENVEARIERNLKMLDLWPRRFEPVAAFSKGMRQKLAVARTLLHDPEVLFLDEPTSGLDPQVARLVRDFIADLKGQGRTIILSTHNLAEADRLCDRVAVFNRHLLALDSPRVLRHKIFGRKVVFHLKSYLPAYRDALENYPFVKDLQEIDGKLLVTLENPEENNPVLIRSLVEAGADLQFVGEIRRRLEDVYLELVQGDGDDSNE
jgi:ABC-2 type transport system ATP-binding protein